MATRFRVRVQQQRGKRASIFILIIIIIIIIRTVTRGFPDRFPTVDFPTLPTETYGITCTPVMPFFYDRPEQARAAWQPNRTSCD
ncbi:hypothetical protein CFR77_00030 [Komagataeibacter sucrofermentans]|uniref:Uncharacterized protein n=1 Tax=Komagataeibacter sucrofermentans TaxID=1053551 RepID=A0A318QZZ9_9PROT|nr:hypothetical protein CFR77_00030 [Komagataeibacter sucrofermentans]